jgi:hypothetical protein
MQGWNTILLVIYTNNLNKSNNTYQFLPIAKLNTIQTILEISSAAVQSELMC